jgi:hypothetical protein
MLQGELHLFTFTFVEIQEKIKEAVTASEVSNFQNQELND